MLRSSAGPKADEVAVPLHIKSVAWPVRSQAVGVHRVEWDGEERSMKSPSRRSSDHRCCCFFVEISPTTRLAASGFDE